MSNQTFHTIHNLVKKGQTHTTQSGSKPYQIKTQSGKRPEFYSPKLSSNPGSQSTTIGSRESRRATTNVTSARRWARGSGGTSGACSTNSTTNIVLARTLYFDKSCLDWCWTISFYGPRERSLPWIFRNLVESDVCIDLTKIKFNEAYLVQG